MISEIDRDRAREGKAWTKAERGCGHIDKHANNYIV